MQIRLLKNFLHRTSSKYGVVFCHHNADPDTLYASHVFSKLLRKLRPRLRCDIVPAEGISSLSKTIMEEVKVEFSDSPMLEKADFVVLVDTSTTSQLGEWGLKVEKSGKPLIVVDHHSIHPKTRKLAGLMMVKTDARSTCELVYELCRKAKFKISRKDALGLFFGVAYETRGFRYASAKTFQVLLELLKLGVDLEKALKSMTMPMSKPEKIARLKAASRLELHKIGEWLLVFSHVSSYQASVARGLIGLGADVAVVAGERMGEIKISLRSTSNFCEETGIHLGEDVAFILGEKFSGMGGGHQTSAGVNGRGNLNKVIPETLEILKGKITHQK